MYKRELYVEFYEHFTHTIRIEQKKLISYLKFFDREMVIAYEETDCVLYFNTHNIKKKMNEKYFGIKEGGYHLLIDSAARIRFEGDFQEYERIIKKIRLEIRSGIIYVVLRVRDLKCNFFIIDIYFELNG